MLPKREEKKKVSNLVPRGLTKKGLFGNYFVIKNNFYLKIIFLSCSLDEFLRI